MSSYDTDGCHILGLRRDNKEKGAEVGELGRTLQCSCVHGITSFLVRNTRRLTVDFIIPV